MIFRLSQKLSTKISAGKLNDEPLDNDPYADWSSHLFTADRTHYILLTNTSSLYSCVMFGKGITGDQPFIERTLSTIRDFTEYDGQAFVYQRFIAPSSSTVTFAKALNRSVTGSMSEMIYHAKMWLIEDDLSPFDVGFKLNEIPMSPLGYRHPRDQFKTMLDSPSMMHQDSE